MSKRRTRMFLALLTAFVVVQHSSTAVAETGSNSSARPTDPKKPPKVDGAWLKETGRLIGTTTTTTRGHKPGKKTDGRPEQGKRAPDRPARWGRDDPATNALIESRLNDGICNRLPDGTIEGPSRCEDYYDTQTPARPTVEQSVDLIRHEIQRQTVDLPFPKHAVKVQPAGRTLVNLDTIVYTDKQESTTMSVMLLGFPVTVVGRPVSYTWHFGDGTPALTTTSPGSPYPSKEITHKYLNRGAVRLSVTTNYSAAFNVAGTGWRTIDGTLPVTGPVTPLEVREAVPVLVEPGR